MNINWNVPSSENPARDILSKNKLPIFFPEPPSANQGLIPSTSGRMVRRRFRIRKRVLREASAVELANLDHEVLVEAIRIKGVVLTTDEMARLAKCDKETIRRRVKDGTLKKAKGIRHNRVSWENFHDWVNAKT